jgi:creatinine amidohydrolase
MGSATFDETMVNMTWPEIEKAAEQAAMVLLPTGVIEEHGPHMGLGVDTLCSSLSSK